MVCAPRARAGGFYLLPRGTRGAAQGGAVVAGSNDPGALWYNPAGLAFSGKQALADFVMTFESVDFERINSGGQKDPAVTMNSAPLPLPGFAYSDNFGLKKWTFGLGMFAPPSTMLKYPQGAVYPDTGKVGPPPQGYSALGMEGSALLFLDFGIAFRPHPGISIGATAGALVGKFQARVLTFLADGGAMGQPENEEYDASHWLARARARARRAGVEEPARAHRRILPFPGVGQGPRQVQHRPTR
jgi:long-chain fatty acid transport protein